MEERAEAGVNVASHKCLKSRGIKSSLKPVNILITFNRTKFGYVPK